jgi:hypothetical protein
MANSVELLCKALYSVHFRVFGPWTSSTLIQDPGPPPTSINTEQGQDKTCPKSTCGSVIRMPTFFTKIFIYLIRILYAKYILELILLATVLYSNARPFTVVLFTPRRNPIRLLCALVGFFRRFPVVWNPLLPPCREYKFRIEWILMYNITIYYTVPLNRLDWRICSSASVENSYQDNPARVAIKYGGWVKFFI